MYTLKELIEKLQVPDFIVDLTARIKSHGFKAYVVGGAVRDLLLGKEPEDWDVATDASPEDLKAIFDHVVPTGIKHGTVTVITGNKAVEVTRFRGGEDSRSDIRGDLRYRDFTINAIAYDPFDKKIIDPWDGIKDLRMGIIRAVEEPVKRFKEDPLRVLRALRLSASLGFSIDEKTYRAIPGFAPSLKMVSVERIREEFLKILDTGKPSKPIDKARESGILAVILPELLEGYKMTQNRYHRYDVYWHSLKTSDYIHTNPYLRWVGLLHDIGKPRTRKLVNGVYHFYGHAKESAKLAFRIMKRWRFSNDETEKAVRLIENHMLHNFKSWKPATFRRLIIRVGRENVDDLLHLWKADRLAHGTEPHDKIERDFKLLREKLYHFRSTFDVLSVKDLSIGGKEVMEILGVKPGPVVGRVLHRLLEEVIKNPARNNSEDLRALVEEMKSDYEGTDS